MRGIQNRAGWAVAAALALIVVAALSGAVSSGPLDPPGPPAPTDATEITAIPYTISAPGAYVVKKNLTHGSLQFTGVGISVNASNVTIDLNGFTLNGVPGATYGIFSGPQSRLTVRNGTIAGWGCAGVSAAGTANSQYEGLKITGNGNISACYALDVGLGSTVSDCAVDDNANGIKIEDGTVTNCTVRGNDNIGIYARGSTVTNCVVKANVTGISLTDGAVTNCNVRENGRAGIEGSGVIRDNVVNENGVLTAGPAIGVLSKSVVTGNTVSGNGENAIVVTGDGNYITDNEIAFNSTVVIPSSAIYVSGTATNNRIEGNNISGNHYGIYVDGSLNLVVRNSLSGVTGTWKIFAGGSNNTYGPEQTAGTTLSNPWANIIY